MSEKAHLRALQAPGVDPVIAVRWARGEPSISSRSSIVAPERPVPLRAEPRRPFAVAYPRNTSTPSSPSSLPSLARETCALLCRTPRFSPWLAFDPCVLCLNRKAELERLRLRYVDCGRKDEYALDVGARVLARRMREMGLTVRHEEFDDDHRNVGYRYAASLPALARAMERSR